MVSKSTALLLQALHGYSGHEAEAPTLDGSLPALASFPKVAARHQLGEISGPSGSTSSSSGSFASFLGGFEAPAKTKLVGSEATLERGGASATGSGGEGLKQHFLPWRGCPCCSSSCSSSGSGTRSSFSSQNFGRGTRQLDSEFGGSAHALITTTAADFLRASESNPGPGGAEAHAQALLNLRSKLKSLRSSFDTEFQFEEKSNWEDFKDKLTVGPFPWWLTLSAIVSSASSCIGEGCRMCGLCTIIGAFLYNRSGSGSSGSSDPPPQEEGWFGGWFGGGAVEETKPDPGAGSSGGWFGFGGGAAASGAGAAEEGAAAEEEEGGIFSFGGWGDDDDGDGGGDDDDGGGGGDDDDEGCQQQ